MDEENGIKKRNGYMQTRVIMICFDLRVSQFL